MENLEEKRMNENDDKNVEIMSFGKYKDKPISIIPSDYIAWTLKESSVIERDADLKIALENELVNRLIRVPKKDRLPAIDKFVTAYENHKKNADINEYEFERIVIDKLYECIDVI